MSQLVQLECFSAVLKEIKLENILLQLSENGGKLKKLCLKSSQLMSVGKRFPHD